MMSNAALQTLPKAELHIHIEGTLEPDLAFRLALRNHVSPPAASIEALRQRYAFDDLQSFLDLYYACMAVLRTREDFTLLAAEYLHRAAAQGVRHVELFFDPQAHVQRGVPVDAVIDGLLDALREAERDLGMSGGLILCFLRDQPVEDAMATLQSVSHRTADLLGVGLDSAEVGHPPGEFAPVFAAAKGLGLHLVAHAGEEGPPEYVIEALDVLRVERIDHGIRAADDPALIERLAAERIPLTVCPLSNLRLRAVPTLGDHPILRLLRSGVCVSVHSDDPAYFGGYIGDNFVALDAAVDLDPGTAGALARNSILSSFAPVSRQAELLAEIDEWEHIATLHTEDAPNDALREGARR